MRGNISKTGTTTRKKTSAKARRRRRKSKFLATFMVLMLVAGTAIVLSLTVFFGITDIRISGDYSAEEVRTKLSVQLKDNLFLASETMIKNEILLAYGDADSVSVKKQLPGILNIQVIKGVATSAFYRDGQYVIISQSGRVMDLRAQEIPEGVVRIEGVELPAQIQKGEYLDIKQLKKYDVVKKIYDSLTAGEIGSVTCIRVDDEYDLQAVVDDRLVIRFGANTELDYKLKFAISVIGEKIKENETGTVDASIAGKVNFIPLREGETIR